MTTPNTTILSNNQEKAEEYGWNSEIPPDFSVKIQSPSRRSFVEKFGLYNIGLSVIGTVACFLATTFLALLSSGSEDTRHGRPTPML